MSTAGLFQPSRADGRSDWRVVFDVLEKLAFGEEVSHDDLMAELGTDDRGRLYRAVNRANRELWKTRDRSVGVVKGHGYRMLHPQEMEPLANGYRKQARRKMSSAVAVIDATDLNHLDDQQREWIVKVQAGLHLLARAMDSHAARLAKHDDLINKLQARVERLEDAR